MVANVLEELGQIPMSPYLVTTLGRATDYASQQSHRFVSLEHLLLALTEDPEASIVLRTSDVDIAQLTTEVSNHLGQQNDRVSANETPAQTISEELRRVLGAAAAAAQQGRRREINGAIVLAAIVGDGKSAAAHILRTQGLTFEEAIRALQRAVSEQSTEQEVQPEEVPSTSPTQQPTKPSPATQPVPQISTPPITREPAQWTPPEEHAEVPPQDMPSTAPPPAGQSASSAETAVASPTKTAPSPKQGQPIPRTPSAARHRQPAPGPAAPSRRNQTGLEAQSFPHHVDTDLSTPSPAPTPATARQAPQHQRSKRTPAPAPSKTRGGVARSAAGSGPFVGPWPLIEAGQLVENIPRRMRTGIPVVVEARIARANVKALAEGLQGGGSAYQHEIIVTKAMAVRLRGSDGSFIIEPRSPETQWIDNILGMATEDFASWRWTVTPKERGKRKLQLVVSARTVGADGLTAETALPDQWIDVKVGINYGATAKSMFGWIAIAVIGGVFGRFGEDAFNLAKAFLTKVMNG